MNLWLVSNIRLDASEGLKASGIQNLRTAAALADRGHRVLVWCDRIGAGGVAWAGEQIGRPFPETMSLMQATARARPGEKRSAFGSGGERLLHFVRGRLSTGPPDVVLSRSPTVLRQLRDSRVVGSRTRLALELQYPEWSFLWRDWARRHAEAGTRAAVEKLKSLKQDEREGYAGADGILYAARAHERVLEKAGYDGPKRWIPSAAIAPEAGPRPETTEFDLGYAGSLAPENGLETLLEATAGMPEVRLLMLGSGRSKYVERLKAKAETLGIEERVSFGGSIPPSEVRSWMRRCAVGVVPLSRRCGPEKRLYASPLKLIEWMAAGVPVAGSRVPSIVQHEEAGEPIAIFEPDDSESLMAVVGALRRDEERMRSMARAGLEAARGRSFDARAGIIETFAEALEGMAVDGHGH